MSKFSFSAARAKPSAGSRINAKFVNNINTLATDSPDAWTDEASGEGTPVERVAAARGVGPVEAALWLCERLGIEPKSVDYIAPAKPVNLFPDAEGEGGAPADLHVDSDGRIVDRATGETVHDPSSFSEKAVAACFPERLIPKTGLIADFVDLFTKTNPHINKISVFASVVTTISLLAGRTWLTPERDGGLLNLYVMMVAGTGEGKGDYLKTNKTIHSKVQLWPGVTARFIAKCETFKSGASIYEWLSTYPTMAVSIDEFGDEFKNVMSDKASPHVKEIASLFKKIFGLGHSCIDSPAYKDKDKSYSIHAPALTMATTSTPGQLWTALTKNEVEGGLINRFWFVPVDEKVDYEALRVAAKARREAQKNGEKPVVESPRLQELCDKLSDIWACGTSSEHLRRDALESSRLPKMKQTIQYESEDVHDAFFDYFVETRTQWPKGSTPYEFHMRAAEYAIKLACIYALSENQKAPIITMDAMAWGIEAVRYSFAYSYNRATRHMAENETHRNRNQIIEILAKADGAMTKTALHRALPGASGPKFRDAVEMLTASDLLTVLDNVKPAGRGPVATYYMLSPEAVFQ